MGANAHGKIIEYVKQLNKNTSFVEIGMAHDPHPDSSTCELFRIANEHGINMYSIDTNEYLLDAIIERSPEVFYNPNYNVIIGDGEDFLKNYPGKPISFAYLDNFDWMYNPQLYWEEQEPEWQHQQYLDYQAKGVELNNINSALAHLKQTMLIEALTDEKAVILYDDTWFSDISDNYVGKGCASIYYLLAKGWEVIPFTKHDLPYGSTAIMLGKNIIPNKEGTIH